MGGINSKAFNELLEDTSPSPVQDGEKKTLDTWQDPRSPTTGITRTPIQVEKTPETTLDPRSPNVGMPRTPIHTNSKMETIVDPRSPTIGITRTPIYGVTDGDSETQCGLEDASLSLEDASLSSFSSLGLSDHSSQETVADPLPLNLDMSDAASEESDRLSLTRSLSQPDLSTEQVRLIRHKNDHVGASFRLPGFGHKKQARNTRVVPNDRTCEILADDIIQRSKGSPLSSHRLKTDSKRSPLTTFNVDMASPRAIVQHKQTTKLNKMRGSLSNTPKKYQVFADDKENFIA